MKMSNLLDEGKGGYDTRETDAAIKRAIQILQSALGGSAAKQAEAADKAISAVVGVFHLIPKASSLYARLDTEQIFRTWARLSDAIVGMKVAIEKLDGRMK